MVPTAATVVPTAELLAKTVVPTAATVVPTAALLAKTVVPTAATVVPTAATKVIHIQKQCICVR